jgi:hypothetical protein
LERACWYEIDNNHLAHDLKYRCCLQGRVGSLPVTMEVDTVQTSQGMKRTREDGDVDGEDSGAAKRSSTTHSADEDVVIKSDPINLSIIDDCKQFGSQVGGLTMTITTKQVNKSAASSSSAVDSAVIYASLPVDVMVMTVIELMQRVQAVENVFDFALCACHLKLWKAKDEVIDALLDATAKIQADNSSENSFFSAESGSSQRSQLLVIILLAGGLLPKLRRLTNVTSRTLFRSLQLAYRLNSDFFCQCVLGLLIRTPARFGSEVTTAAGSAGFAYVWECVQRFSREVPRCIVRRFQEQQLVIAMVFVQVVHPQKQMDHLLVNIFSDPSMFKHKKRKISETQYYSHIELAVMIDSIISQADSTSDGNLPALLEEFGKQLSTCYSNTKQAVAPPPASPPAWKPVRRVHWDIHGMRVLTPIINLV